MSFLDNNGLSYFYGKIKEKFIRSVNSGLPDENGNVEITNVATADNLTSPDEQSSYSHYFYRTSGGKASLSSGEAELVYVDGNMQINGRVAENFNITTENDIVITYSAATWRTQITTSGNYYFYYVKPTSSVATTSSWTDSGSWNHASSTGIDISEYGLYASNIINPSVTITVNATGLQSASVVPNTFITKVTDPETYVFIYSEDTGSGAGGWLLGEDVVDLEEYGITTIDGTPVAEDSIVITYIAGTPNSTIIIVYTAPDQGTILVPKPTKFVSTGFNQFDKDTMFIADASISGPSIISSPGTYIGYCKAVGNVNNGYVAYSSSSAIKNIAYSSIMPSIGNTVTSSGATVTGNVSSITFENNGYVVVAVSNLNDLCIHPKWSGAEDTTYASYITPSEIALPTVAANGSGLPLGDYGIPAIGAIADRLDLDKKQYIQRIGRLSNTTSNMNYVIGLNVTYEYDDSNIYYILPEELTYGLSSELNSKYIVNDYGTEEFVGTNIELGAQNLYGQNLRDKLRTDVLTLSEQALSSSQKVNVWDNVGIFVTDAAPASGAEYGIYFVYES